jgi:F0F1-type ATP synthase membrane subunit c/vacuolar-type H+-ATPase subunit K
VAGAAGRPLNLAFHSFEARHACNRAASSSSGIGLWAYLAVFAATAAGYMAIRIGTAAIGAAAVLSSQGQLIITAVLIVAVIGNGQQLYVSHNTIHSHVRSIYRKLGVSSRAHALQRTASSGSCSRGAWLPACVPACSPGR